MKPARIPQKKMEEVLVSLTGMPISRAWRGYGSAVFLELGKLSSRKNKMGRITYKGKITIMVEWSWRVEKARSIWFGSFSSKKKMEIRLPSLEGCKIKSASLFGRLPELQLSLSRGLWFNSFMTEQGQQEWAILTSDGSYFPKGKSYYKEAKN